MWNPVRWAVLLMHIRSSASEWNFYSDVWITWQINQYCSTIWTVKWIMLHFSIKTLLSILFNKTVFFFFANVNSGYYVLSMFSTCIFCLYWIRNKNASKINATMTVMTTLQKIKTNTSRIWNLSFYYAACTSNTLQRQSKLFFALVWVFIHTMVTM